jgi:type I restriction enzyme M protein
LQGAQDRGEFFTPVWLVQTIVNVIEPNQGTVFGPACGTGGVFVQTSRTHLQTIASWEVI